jgi:hypothetical protein
MLGPRARALRSPGSTARRTSRHDAFSFSTCQSVRGYKSDMRAPQVRVASAFMPVSLRSGSISEVANRLCGRLLTP